MAHPLDESPFRLLVEGPDDFNSVIHLMARHGYKWEDESSVRPFISSAGGITSLLGALSVALRGAYERIGVVLDANLSLRDRWSQIRNRAQQAGVALPDSPLPEGTIVPGRRPRSRVGFWLMPDNSSPGALESFLVKLVPLADPSWSYADEVVIEARRRGALCREKDHAKSALHTWLAWQEEPGLPFGTALKAEIFEKDSDDALRFVAWFNRLFVDS